MEEELKILEELNENLKQKPLNCDVYIREDDRLALENLLIRYKQLEEKNKNFYEGEIFTAKQLKNIEQNQKKYFINKQVVKEKIEELKKKVEELTDEQGYWGGSDLLEQIKVLQELLESEK